VGPVSVGVPEDGDYGCFSGARCGCGGGYGDARCGPSECCCAYSEGHSEDSLGDNNAYGFEGSLWDVGEPFTVIGGIKDPKDCCCKKASTQTNTDPNGRETFVGACCNVMRSD